MQNLFNIVFVFTFHPSVTFQDPNYAYFGIGKHVDLVHLRQMIAATHQLGLSIGKCHPELGRHAHGMCLRLARLSAIGH